MSLSSSQQDVTRWRSFQQVNRHKPWKQALQMATWTLLACAYLYCLLLQQPQQSHDFVVKYNIAEAEQYHQERQRLVQLQLERRREFVRKRKEANLKRARAKNATLVALLQSNNYTTTENNNTENNNSTSSNITNRHYVGKSSTSIGRFVGAFLSFVASLFMFARAGLAIKVCAPSSSRRRRLSSVWQQGGGGSATAAAIARRGRRLERETRFREWAQRLNQQRQEQGEPPLSLQSLRLVMRGRDLTSGNDYEGLLQFNEEAGPAMHALLQSMGATKEEIDRCPHRVLMDPNDDLLAAQSHGDKKEPPHCAVCLERYVLMDEVRTIPCFHTFHTKCIDPWLAQKAVCPVCKHPAVG